MAFQGAIKAGRAFVELFADHAQLTRDLRTARRKLMSWGRSMSAIGRRLAATSALFALPLVLSIKAAGAAIETLNKFEAVFGRQAEAAAQFGDALADAVGRSKFEIRDSLASFQAFFVGLEFGAEEARNMAEAMTELSIDFASFFDIADADALAKFQSGLSGMARPLRSFGINILDSAVSARALAMGLGRGTKELTMQEKVLARYAIIMETMTTQGAVGDAIKTAGTFTNRMKALRGKIHEAAVEIGNALIPVVTPLVAKMVKAALVIRDWAKAFPEIIKRIALLVVGVGLLGIALIGLGTTMTLMAIGIQVLITLFAALKVAVALIVSPLGLIVVLALAAAAAFLLFTDAGRAVLAWVGDKFREALAVAKMALGGIVDALSSGDFALAAEILWLSVELAFVTGTFAVLGVMHDMWLAMKVGWIVSKAAALVIWSELTAALQTIWAIFIKQWKRDQANLQAGIEMVFLKIRQVMEGLSEQWLKDAISAVANQRDATLRAIETAHIARLIAIEDARVAETDAARAVAKERVNAILDERDLREELLKIAERAKRAELDASIAAAAAGAVTAAEERKAQQAKIDEVTKAAAQLSLALGGGGGFKGTFSAAAQGQLFSDRGFASVKAVIEIQTRITEQNERNTRAMATEGMGGVLR